MKRRAYSLVELLVGITISFLIIGGLLVTFNAVNTGVKNANRSNDLTQQTRNVFQLLNADLFAAGRGIGDLTSLQVHFNHPRASAAEAFFYPIVLQPKVNGSSQIVIQWFEYDFFNNPTFMVINVDPGALAGTTLTNVPTRFDLFTNDPADPALAQVAVGDLLLLYDPEVFYEIDRHKDLHDQVNPDYSWDEAVIGNGAMILEVTGVAQNLANGIVSVSVGTGAAFGLPALPPENGYRFTGSADPNTAVNTAATQGRARFQFRPPTGAWVARKLSDTNGFRRIRYFVNNTGALIRQDEGVGQPVVSVLATNVTNFEFRVGTDILDPLSAADQDVDAWDNAVSDDDLDDYWLDQGSSVQDVTLAGRHPVAIQVSLTIEGLTADLQESAAAGTAVFNLRTFAKHYKLRNVHTPLISY